MATKQRTYTGDIEGDDFGFLKFTIIRHSLKRDQPWEIASEAENDTHHTLDELLFWNLIMGGRMISEQMRASILSDFGEIE